MKATKIKSETRNHGPSRLNPPGTLKGKMPVGKPINTKPGGKSRKSPQNSNCTMGPTGLGLRDKGK